MDLNLEPLSLFSRIPDESRGLVFLASDGSFDARWSILATNPVLVLRSDQEHFREHLDSTLKSRKKNIDSDLPFIGGAILSMDFEYGYPLLSLPQKFSGPLATVSFYDSALVFDHHQNRWHEVGEKNDSWKSWKDLPPKILQEPFSLDADWDFNHYQKAFESIHQDILHGEMYQACLSFPFHGPPVKSPRSLFYRLMQRNPAPMGLYLEEPHRTILSLSPERFILLNKNQIETKPIKGTRPKGYLPDEQLKNQLELLSDQKEAAELSMITDLLRNDLATISKPGSVKILEHRAIQECPKVWHTYSHIVGIIQEEKSPWEVLEAMFPGGSISGCPKRRAVEILSSVENYRRGIYTGCLGYISDHGRMDINIAIRTLEMTKEGIRTGFGGGIVSDSQVEKEYEECLLKSQTFHD